MGWATSKARGSTRAAPMTTPCLCRQLQNLRTARLNRAPAIRPSHTQCDGKARIGRRLTKRRRDRGVVAIARPLLLLLPSRITTNAVAAEFLRHACRRLFALVGFARAEVEADAQK